MLSREATNANFIVFGLTRLGLEPTIYRTQGEHANHYTTDADPAETGGIHDCLTGGTHYGYDNRHVLTTYLI